MTRSIRHATFCPSCGQLVDGHTNMTGDTGPVCGDATICIYCVTAAVYDEDMQLRLPTELEADLIARDGRFQLLIEILLASHERGILHDRPD